MLTNQRHALWVACWLLTFRLCVVLVIVLSLRCLVHKLDRWKQNWSFLWIEFLSEPIHLWYLVKWSSISCGSAFACVHINMESGCSKGWSIIFLVIHLNPLCLWWCLLRNKPAFGTAKRCSHLKSEIKALLFYCFEKLKSCLDCINSWTPVLISAILLWSASVMIVPVMPLVITQSNLSSSSTLLLFWKFL